MSLISCHWFHVSHLFWDKLFTCCLGLKEKHFVWCVWRWRLTCDTFWVTNSSNIFKNHCHQTFRWAARPSDVGTAHINIIQYIIRYLVLEAMKRYENDDPPRVTKDVINHVADQYPNPSPDRKRSQARCHPRGLSGPADCKLQMSGVWAWQVEASLCGLQEPTRGSRKMMKHV